MKFMVGLNGTKPEFTEEICKNAAQIHEVYFSWGDFANGRSRQTENALYLPWEMQAMQMEALEKLSASGIKLNILFNANCYGKDSQSRAFFEKIGNTVDFIRSRYGLASVTTTSPLIAKFFKNNFEELEVRASVNMEIGTIQGMDYLASYFDGYYMKRELNRDFGAIERLSGWCRDNGKKLYMLANSGCLNHCSAHVFHDNLVAHESEIAQMDNAYAFQGMCREYLQSPEHYKALIEDTNFVRPEDLWKYEPYFEAVKLATRVHKNPSMVLRSYLNSRYSGNILELLEPAHNIYPYVVENGDTLKLKRIDTDVIILGGEET